MNLYDIVTPMTVDEAKATSQRLDAKCWAGKHKAGTKIKGGVRVNNCVPNEGIAEAETDYSKRRARERDVDAGKPVAKQRRSGMTDYQKRRAEQKRQEQLGENAWNDGTNDWTSEHDQWTKESAEPVTELKIDPRKAKPGQTQDEKYKGWNLRYQMRPTAGSKEYKGRADNLQSQKTQPIGPISAASAEELLQQLKDAIDSSRGSNAITTGRVTIFFNANLAKDVIGHGGDIYADIEQHGDTPLLLLSTEDQGGMIRAQDRSSVAVKGREGHIGAQAFAFPADKAKAAGLTLARYALGQPINYAPGVTAIPLEFRNEVYPGETVRMDEPGLTVSPPKMGQTMGEDGMIAPDSTSPVGGNVQEARLTVGDPVIVTAPNEFEGKTGEISEFSPSGKFVIVNLYNHGEHSMHLSDVEYNQYADKENDLDEDTGTSPVASAIVNRIMRQRTDLLKQYGPELVGASVDNVADYVGDVEEIGSSDVSAWVAQVERMLRDNPPEAFAEGFQDFNKVEPYAVCLAGKPVKQFDYYADARRFHDNWKKKLYNQGDKAKADKITLMPLNLDEARYTPSPAKPFRNPPGFNKQGTGIGNKLADLNRAELANIQPSKGTPVPAKAFAQGIEKDLQKAMTKPKIQVKKNKGVAEDWIDDDAAEPLAKYFADLYYGDFSVTMKIKLAANIYQSIQNGELSIEQLKADIDMLEKEKGIKEAETDYSKRRAQQKKEMELGESTNYWTKLQNERNTKLNTLVNELKEITK